MKNVIFGMVSLIIFVAGFIFGWQTKSAVEKQKEDDNSKGITRYHRMKFGTMGV